MQPVRMEIRKRVRHPMEVIAPVWDEPVVLDTEDLSPRGAYVRSPVLPDPGETVVCRFALGPGLVFEFFGNVVRADRAHRATDRRGGGFGVVFLDATPIERLKIREVLRPVPPPVPVMRQLPSGPVRRKERPKN